VSTRVPDVRPPLFVQVRRDGGTARAARAPSDELLRDSALIDFFVWGTDEDPTWLKAMELRSLLMLIDMLQPFSAPCYAPVEFTGPVWVDDFTPGMPVPASKVWMSYEIPTRIKET
jgi:hypothetical protein